MLKRAPVPHLGSPTPLPPLEPSNRGMKWWSLLFHLLLSNVIFHMRGAAWKLISYVLINAGRSPGKSPGLTLDLGSKNPFRNRTTSPANDHLGSTLSSPAPTSPFDDPIRSGRPLSTNPFLDPVLSKQSEPLVSPPGAMSTQSDKRASPTAEELFVCLDHH